MQQEGATTRQPVADMATASVKCKAHLSRRQLKEIPRDVLELASSILQLDLSQNRGIRVAGDLSKFINVIELSLEHCCLHDIPKELESLKNLELLVLSGNRLESPPSDLSKLTTLKKLELRDCGLSQLPDDIESLSLLEELDLKGNRAMRTFPTVLLRLCNLRILKMSDCGLSKLPDEIGTLKALEELKLSDNKDLQGLPRDLAALAKLRVLELWNCGISEMPVAIKDLSSLEVLLLGGNPLERIPPDMTMPPNLRTLSLNECRLSSLPGDIGKLKSLVELQVKGNRDLKTFPVALVHLPNLRKLSLCRSGLSDLPGDIGRLTALEELKMSGISFRQSLPPWLAAIRNLRVLDISSCGLSKLPRAIAELTSLEVLDIYSNGGITSLPSDMAALRQLRKLDACFCNLSTFPEVVEKLAALEELKLSHNPDIVNMPPSVTALKKLRVLRLSSCRLSKLPDAIEKLTSLEELDLSENGLGTFPEALLRLSSLRILDLNECGFSNLPDAIRNLTALEELNISKNNAIKRLPAAICELPSLKKLDVSNCSLSRLPDKLEQLKTLEDLKLRDNPFTYGLPPLLATLKNLKVLDISSCGLQRLPKFIEELTHLEELRACNNHLQTYPVVTLDLKELRSLELSNDDDLGDDNCKGNAISDLPVQLLYTSLTKLNLKGNPMNQPPQEVCDQGVEAILLYLKNISKKELVCPDTVNMLGDVGAGKTSIALSLRSGQRIAAGIHDHGNVMNQYRVAIAGRLVNLNDFDGHEIYHAFIPILLSANGISIIAYNMSEKVNTLEQQKESVSKWLMTLFAKSSQIRVFIAGTHSDEVSPDRRKFLEKHMEEHIKFIISSAQEEIMRHIAVLQCRKSPQCCEKLCHLERSLAVLRNAYISFTTLSCTVDDDNKGFETLLERLEKKLNPSSPTPASWWFAMNTILNHETGLPYIKWKEVKESCRPYLPTDDYGTALRVILRYLAATSQIIWLEGSSILKKVIFHQPKRLVDVFVKVLCHDYCPKMEDSLSQPYYEHHLMEYRRGYLVKDFLAQLLLSPHDMLDFMSELLVQFNIVSPIDSERYVITSKLHSDRPQTFASKLNESDVQPSINVQLRFLGSHMPLALFATVLASVLSWVHSVNADPQIWKHGILSSFNRVTFMMHSTGAALDLTAFSVSLDEDVWSVLHPVLKRIRNTVDESWKGAPPLCLLTCPGCRRRERPPKTRTSLHGRHTTLYELGRPDPLPTLAPWYCNNCQKDIPNVLCFPRLPGRYSTKDMAEVSEFLSDQGAPSSHAVRESADDFEPMRKQRRSDSLEGACNDEVDGACLQPTVLGKKLKKSTAMLIEGLENSDILSASDVLYARDHMSRSEYDDIISKEKNSRSDAARFFIRILSRLGDNAILAFLVHLESKGGGGAELAKRVRDTSLS